MPGRLVRRIAPSVAPPCWGRRATAWNIEVAMPLRPSRHSRQETAKPMGQVSPARRVPSQATRRSPAAGGRAGLSSSTAARGRPRHRACTWPPWARRPTCRAGSCSAAGRTPPRWARTASAMRARPLMSSMLCNCHITMASSSASPEENPPRRRWWRICLEPRGAPRGLTRVATRSSASRRPLGSPGRQGAPRTPRGCVSLLAHLLSACSSRRALSFAALDRVTTGEFLYY